MITFYSTNCPKCKVLSTKLDQAGVKYNINTDINTIFGSVINENLTDEVIVTVIATGFDKKNKKPLYNQLNKKTEANYIDDDEDEGSGETNFEPQEIEIPTFMHRNF